MIDPVSPTNASGSLTTACLAVVVPVYNEAATVANVVKTVLAQPLVQELIVVDDGSTDGTWEALQPLAKSDARIKLFRHDKNQGKGRGVADRLCPGHRAARCGPGRRS